MWEENLWEENLQEAGHRAWGSGTGQSPWGQDGLFNT